MVYPNLKTGLVIVLTVLCANCACAQLAPTTAPVATMVLGGKTFWGLQSGSWGTATGTMPTVGAVTYTPGTVDQAVAAGYHNGEGKVVGDADLTESNII